MSKKKEPILVLTFKDESVNEAKLFYEVHDAEECFTLKALDLGARKGDMSNHLDNGYYNNAPGIVYILWPEVCIRK